MRTLDWLTVHDPLRVVALEDPVIDSLGFDPRSGYVETYWLSVLGPSATLAARALARALERSPQGITVPLVAFAGQLGLGGGTGRHSKVIARALGRLVDFNMAQIAGEALAMRRRFPPLARRHIMRLPDHLAAMHQAELDRMANARTASR